MIFASIISKFRLFAIMLFSAVLALPAINHDALAAESIKEVRGPLINVLLRGKVASAGSLKDFYVTGDKRAAFRKLVTSLVRGDEEAASRFAAKIDYEVLKVSFGGNRFLVIRDLAKRRGQPTIIVNLEPRLKALIGVPHPNFEKGTLEQAVVLLGHAGARAAIIAGAHRCASRTAVGCDGKTRVCGSLASYRQSDVAHNPATLFHIAHEELLKNFPNDIVFSLHGMRNDEKGIKTSIILSDGSLATDNRHQSVATKLRVVLGETYQSEGRVISCDLSSDKRFEARRLCGRTNVQGRLVNGGRNICHSNVKRGTGRFVHVEQDKKTRNAFRKVARGGSAKSVENFINATRSVVPAVGR